VIAKVDRETTDQDCGDPLNETQEHGIHFEYRYKTFSQADFWQKSILQPNQSQ
jgi:hypothetical protein